MMYRHEKIKITRECGERVDGIAPIIISESRSTDIPAFHSDWLFNRIDKGYCAWVNPFNQKPTFVSFEKTRCFVFWSKNPAPLIDKLPFLKQRSVNSYVQFTLNDYSPEGLEPGIPCLSDRLDTFKRLVDVLGVGAVIWRYDPVILTDAISIDSHIERIMSIGECLKGYCEKLVFSFADISSYKKVQFNLNQQGINYTDFTVELMQEFAKKLSEANKSMGLNLATCGEMVDLKEYGIAKNKCIDPELLARLFPNDTTLMSWLGYSDMFGAPESFPKDPGQRLSCGCILSKDIGSYNTCGHRCVYCYANASPTIGMSGCNKAKIQQSGETICNSL